MNFLWALGFLILSYAIQALTAKKPAGSAPTPSALSDFDFPQHEEGTPEAVIFGDCWSPDSMVLYTGNFSTQEIKKHSGGKK